jgi:hypothetical protein
MNRKPAQRLIVHPECFFFEAAKVVKTNFGKMLFQPQRGLFGETNESAFLSGTFTTA